MATVKINKPFKEVTGRKLSNTSQLNQFEILNDGTNTFFNLFKNYDIPDSIKENNSAVVMYTIEDKDHWDTISYKFYETSNLWWIIAILNDVTNPFEYLEPGEQVKVIDGRYLYQILKEIKNIKDENN